MSRVCLIFNPLENIMIRGISKYTIETREILLASGAKVHTLVMPSIISRAPRTLQILLFMVFQQVILPIYAVFKRPDVIFDAYNSYSLLAALRWRYVCVIHDFIPFSNKRWWTKPGSIYQRILHRLSPFIPKLELYFINNTVADQGVEIVNKFDGIIPNLVKPLRNFDEVDSDALSLVEKIRFEYSDFLLVTTISGEGKNKDFGGLIKLLGCTKKRIVVVAFGFNGSKIAPLSEYVHVVCPGIVSSQYIGTTISCSDLFLFHSLQEGFGRPVIEALMEGAKVLSISDIPVVNEVPDRLRPLLYLYSGLEDFTNCFIEALRSNRPILEVDNISNQEEIQVAMKILGEK